MPKFEAKWPGGLLEILKDAYPDWKTGTLKQRLKAGLVQVNDKIERSGGAKLDKGDRIEIYSHPAGSRVLFPTHMGEPPMEILYSDHELLAVDKPHGLLSVASPRERNFTAIRLMRDWLSQLSIESSENLHAAHRLDREASGVLLMARSSQVKKLLAASWHTFEKTYLAVTDGVPYEPEGTIDVPLWEDKGLFVRTDERGDGLPAVTHYRTLKSSAGRALIEVKLGTGRKHQIRVHLAHIGCPIVGDLRYGKSKAKRLALHASSLKITHPTTGKEVFIQAATPKFFTNRMKGSD